jgi:hypothetical protein
MPFEMPHEFALIPEHLWTRDFSRAGRKPVACTFQLDWLHG